jgi:hypothetical protein
LFPDDAADYQKVVDEVERMATVGLANDQCANRHRAAQREADPEGVVTSTRRRKVVVPKFRPGTALIDPTRPTRSVLLLREARKAKLLEDLKTESGFMFTVEYEQFVQSQNSQMRSHLLAAREGSQRALPGISPTPSADAANM